MEKAGAPGQVQWGPSASRAPKHIFPLDFSFSVRKMVSDLKIVAQIQKVFGFRRTATLGPPQASPTPLGKFQVCACLRVLPLLSGRCVCPLEAASHYDFLNTPPLKSSGNGYTLYVYRLDYTHRPVGRHATATVQDVCWLCCHLAPSSTAPSCRTVLYHKVAAPNGEGSKGGQSSECDTKWRCLTDVI